MGDSGRDDTADGPPASVLGDCTLSLRHSTTYEPPLYLFPELLPKVPPGSPPITVWDAVADAVDVSASFWRIAEPSMAEAVAASSAAATSPSASGADKHADTQNGQAQPPCPPYGSHENSLLSLAAMISSNRLLPAGLTPEVLEHGRFCAASVIAELQKLTRRCGLVVQGQDTEAPSSSAATQPSVEGSLLMSTHFINLLAWKKLKEINYTGTPSHRPSDDSAGVAQGHASTDAKRTPRTDGGGGGPTTGERQHSGKDDTDTAIGTKRRRRPDDDVAADPLARMRASVDPWSRDVDEEEFAGTFVSGREDDVETRVALLRTLTELYRRPWKQLTSRGVQTDYVVPPGTLNVSSPYADPLDVAVVGAVGAVSPNSKSTLNAADDLGWSPATAASHNHRRGATVAGAAADGAFVVAISTHDATDSARAATGAGACRRVELVAPTTLFGRVAGVQHDSRTGPVRVDVGLSAFTKHAERLSALHLALVLKPQYGDDDSNRAAGGAEHEGEEEDGGDESSPSDAAATTPLRVHRVTPTGHALYLLNYGCNGVRVVLPSSNAEPPVSENNGNTASGSSTRWVLGEAVRLPVGAQVIVAGDINLRILHANDDVDSGNNDRDTTTCSAQCAKRETQASDDDAGLSGGSRVKLEEPEE